MENEDSGPLAGIVVIDASSTVAGPMAAALLGDYGATVIKLEQPRTGENTRRNFSWWNFYSRNKQSVTCDLSNPDGARLFRDLCAKVDVVIEGFRPGTFERWGLSYKELQQSNPNLVFLRVSGFGQTGPYSSRPGYGTLAEAIGGFVYVTGDPEGPPVLPGIPVADVFTGYAGAVAILMGLLARGSDRNQWNGWEIDLSLYGPVLYQFGPGFMEAFRAGRPLERSGHYLAGVPRGSDERKGLRNVVKCADGKWVAYSIVASRLIQRVVDFLDAGDAEGEALNQKLTRWIEASNRSQVIEELAAAEIPIAPVYDALEMLKDPHFIERGEFVTVTTTDGAQVPMPSGPFKINGIPGTVRSAAPELGNDNRSVFQGILGLNDEEYEVLEGRGII